MQALVADQLDLGPDLDDGVEGQRTVVFARGHIDLGRGDRIDLGLTEGGGVVIGQGLTKGLLTNPAATHTGLEQLAGRLARPEAGNPDFTRDFAEGGVDRLIELEFLDLDRQLHLVALEGLDRGLHREGELTGRPALPDDARHRGRRRRWRGHDNRVAHGDGAELDGVEIDTNVTTTLGVEPPQKAGRLG